MFAFLNKLVACKVGDTGESPDDKCQDAATPDELPPPKPDPYNILTERLLQSGFHRTPTNPHARMYAAAGLKTSDANPHLKLLLDSPPALDEAVNKLPTDAIAAILDAMPAEWRGTTFNNSNLHGRKVFVSKLEALLTSGAPITTAALEELGQAEDYLRVSTNITAILEAYLASARGYDVEDVFTFASWAMPIVSVLLTCDCRVVRRVHLCCGPALFGPEELAVLALLGPPLVQHATPPAALAAAADEIVLCVEQPGHSRLWAARSGVHAVVGPSTLYVTDTVVVDRKLIAVVRKRLATPATTPMAEAALRALAAVATDRQNALGASATCALISATETAAAAPGCASGGAAGGAPGDAPGDASGGASGYGRDIGDARRAARHSRERDELLLGTAHGAILLSVPSPPRAAPPTKTTAPSRASRRARASHEPSAGTPWAKPLAITEADVEPVLKAAAIRGAAVGASESATLLAHLQSLSGLPSAASLRPPFGGLAAPPELFTAGLPALAALWLALLAQGGAEVLMCSTAYGGSSQLTDLLADRTAAIAELSAKATRDQLVQIEWRPSEDATDGHQWPPECPLLSAVHAHGLQGDAGVVESVASALAALGERHGASGTLLPTVLLFIETPTNPDLKVADIAELVHTAIAPFVEQYGASTRLVLLFDTTLSPGCAALDTLAECAPELPALVFLSLSKSISRGHTTAGALVPNATQQAAQLMRSLRASARALDVHIKPDQLRCLVDNHEGVEARCKQAYEVASAVGASLCAEVQRRTAGTSMPLGFVTPQQAQAGFHTSTLSFNLPAPPRASDAERAGLAQRFVDCLTAREPTLFKPCVSFGQDNGKVYCTVPATSTQGAIKAADKAKQAVGGVQLVRLSFPPTLDTSRVCKAVADAVESIYA